MSNVARVAGQAANTLSKPLNVEDVFSTYLYTGTNTTNNIDNGIDLSGEGGLLWIKNRDAAQKHVLFDTERGKTKMLQTNDTSDELTNAWLDSFNSNGFSIALGVSNAEINNTAYDYASWTWRKAPKFFDVVTYTGDGALERTISHNLGSSPGCVIVKRTDSTGNWFVGHRSYFQSTSRTSTYNGFLHLTNNMNSSPGVWNFTDTTFSVTSINTNISGATYVAYLFAHNDGDGEFGPDGDADIIKCGSYTGDGTDQFIDLGFEPQWVMIKDATTGGTYFDWYIFDNMRKLDASGSGNAPLMANLSDAEGSAYASSSYNLVQPTPTGMIVEGTSGPSAVGANGDTYIYIAIRRGPMAVPESATDVFTPVLATSSGTFTAEAGFPVDLNWYGRRSVNDGGFTWDRLRGANYLMTNSTGSEIAYSAASFDSNTAFYLDGLTGDYSDFMTYNWRRAPNYFDVVAYTGNGTAGHQIKHNLGVAPDMVWLRSRDLTKDWRVWHKDITDATDGLYLNNNFDVVNSLWFNIDVTGNTGYIELNQTGTNFNGSGNTYIAYLFASLDGVSKVGSYTGNGSTQTIDCGFSAGARFVLIKRTDSTGDWYAWDSVRGIVSGNDPYLRLNVNAAEVTSTDFVDPDSSGFAVNGTTINASGGTYIFYAIA